MDVTLDLVIDSAMQLSLEQRGMLLEILQSRQIEARRQEMACDAEESLTAFRVGKLKGQKAVEIIDELRRELEVDDPETGEEMIMLLDVGSHAEVY
jgi:hypothetical protein